MGRDMHACGHGTKSASRRGRGRGGGHAARLRGEGVHGGPRAARRAARPSRPWSRPASARDAYCFVTASSRSPPDLEFRLIAACTLTQSEPCLAPVVKLMQSPWNCPASACTQIHSGGTAYSRSHQNFGSPPCHPLSRKGNQIPMLSHEPIPATQGSHQSKKDPSWPPSPKCIAVVEG